jgi:peptide deformylase
MIDTLVFDTTKPNYGLESDKKVSIPIFKLVSSQDSLLKEVLPEFDFDNPPVNPNAFASSLVETCKKLNGLGLSANQCGFKHRVFVMGSGEEFVAFFNPKILFQSEKEVDMVEGCLSFPALGLNIKRSESIEVEYDDFNGVKRTTKLFGLSARCFQHELDHMNGIVYTRRVGTVKLQMALNKQKKIMKKLKGNLKET